MPSYFEATISRFLQILYDQVTSYAHGSSDLLGIQIDAAINPGQYYNPFCFTLKEYLFSFLAIATTC